MIVGDGRRDGWWWRVGLCWGGGGHLVRARAGRGRAPAAAPASRLDLLPHADAGGLYAAMALAYRSLSFSACLA